MEIMTKNNNNLIWIDMEMTGLNPVTDKIIEVAVIVTDPCIQGSGAG
jgi:oligoribonuclease